MKVYGYKIVSRPHPVRAGKTSERFEVRPGDCYWDSGWNDCATDRERSELSEQEPYSSVGGEYWYGWSIFIPEDYPNIFPAKTALGQFFQKKTLSPPVMFQNHVGGYWLDLNQMNGSFEAYYLLIPENEFRGRWHDIIVHAKWSTGSDGFIKVWVNGKLKVEHLGPQTMFTYPIFFKYGIYRSFISRYKKWKQLEGIIGEMAGQKKMGKNVDKVPTQIVYFDEVRKGKSRESVDPSLRR